MLHLERIIYEPYILSLRVRYYFNLLSLPRYKRIKWIKSCKHNLLALLDYWFACKLSACIPHSLIFTYLCLCQDIGETINGTTFAVYMVHIAETTDQLQNMLTELNIRSSTLDPKMNQMKPSLCDLNIQLQQDELWLKAMKKKRWRNMNWIKKLSKFWYSRNLLN